MQFEFDTGTRCIAFDQRFDSNGGGISINLSRQPTLVASYIEQDNTRSRTPAQSHAIALLRKCESDAIEARSEIRDSGGREGFDPGMNCDR